MSYWRANTRCSLKPPRNQHPRKVASLFQSSQSIMFLHVYIYIHMMMYLYVIYIYNCIIFTYLFFALCVLIPLFFPLIRPMNCRLLASSTKVPSDLCFCNHLHLPTLRQLRYHTLQVPLGGNMLVPRRVKPTTWPSPMSNEKIKPKHESSNLIRIISLQFLIPSIYTGFGTGVIISPTQTMHYYFREIPQTYHRFVSSLIPPRMV